MKLPQDADSRKPLSWAFKTAFSYLMVCIYLFSGIFLLVKGWSGLTKTQSLGLGILLLVYAVFRIYRIMKESGMEEPGNKPWEE